MPLFFFATSAFNMYNKAKKVDMHQVDVALDNEVDGYKKVKLPEACGELSSAYSFEGDRAAFAFVIFRPVRIGFIRLYIFV